MPTRRDRRASVFFLQQAEGLGAQVRLLSVAKATRKLVKDADIVAVTRRDVVPLAGKTLGGVTRFFFSRPAQEATPWAPTSIADMKVVAEEEEAPTGSAGGLLLGEIFDLYRPSLLVVGLCSGDPSSTVEGISSIVRYARKASASCRIVLTVDDLWEQVNGGQIQAVSDTGPVCMDVDVVACHSQPVDPTRPLRVELSGAQVACGEFTYTGYVRSAVELAGPPLGDVTYDLVINLGTGPGADEAIVLVLDALAALGDPSISALVITRGARDIFPPHAELRIDGVSVARTIPAALPLLRRSRLAVLGGGMALVEAADARVPAIYLPVEKVRGGHEHRSRAQRFESMGFGQVFDWQTRRDARTALASILNRVLHSSPFRPRTRIDGKGAIKTAKLLSSLLRGNGTVPSSYVGKPHKAMVEVSRACNLKCPLCPAGNGLGHKYPSMRLESYERLIDMIAPYIVFLKLYNYGEPLLHPDIIGCVSYAKAAGIESVEITTNGTIMTREIAQGLVEAGLDLFRVSVDGTTQAEYEVYRVGGQLAEVLKNASMVSEARSAVGAESPIIEFQIIAMRQNEASIATFEKMSREAGADRIRVKTLNAYMSGPERKRDAGGLLPENPRFSRYEPGKELSVRPRYAMRFCDWPWTRLVVNANGDVVPCCYDYNGEHSLGHAGAGSFDDLWSTPERSSFQNLHLRKFAPVKLCTYCAYGVPDLGV